MYLMYVDESGDCGLPSEGSPTRFFCLTGVVVHELRWQDTLADLSQFRRRLKRRFRVYLDDELHAGAMISRPLRAPRSFQSLKKFERLAIIRNFAECVAGLSDLRLINVVIDKSGKVPDQNEVFRRAWYTLFQRFENTILQQKFPGPKNKDERGIISPIVRMVPGSAATCVKCA